MNLLNIISIVIVYLMIGYFINWITEPTMRLKFKRYCFANYISLFIDLFFWPIEALIYYSIKLYKYGISRTSK